MSDRFANPGNNRTNWLFIHSGKTNHCHEANSPLSEYLDHNKLDRIKRRELLNEAHEITNQWKYYLSQRNISVIHYNEILRGCDSEMLTDFINKFKANDILYAIKYLDQYSL